MLRRDGIRALFGSALSLGLVLPPLLGAFAASGAAAPAAPIAGRAQALLKQRCGTCHGNTGAPKGINVLQRASLIGTRVVIPHQPDRSTLLTAVTTGLMPQGGSRLSDSEIAVLKSWIQVGAPDWETNAEPPRRPVSEKQVLDAIENDLRSANPLDAPFFRYFSVANLANDPGVTSADLGLYRAALDKLLNSLSGSPEIVRTTVVANTSQTVFRLDLRRLVDLRQAGWDTAGGAWQKIIRVYPYGYVPTQQIGDVRAIQANSPSAFPYVRIDWFVATASVAPLYNEVLGLPGTVDELERSLGVDSQQDLATFRATRSGLRNSGVSRNNRALDRYTSQFGAYWRSYDFADSTAEHNIFLDPVNLHPNGGEFIFHLPNGLQAYYIANGDGKSLDAAPVEIVQDRTNPHDLTVRNGRSCIGCHFRGLNTYQDQVRPNLNLALNPPYDLEAARKLYVPQADLERLFAEDNSRFQDAVRKTGGSLPRSTQDEPISALALHYDSELDLAEAAAETGLPAAKFRDDLNRSTPLSNLGLDQLLTANGAVKRDLWESSFATVIRELGLGTGISFGKAPRAPEADPRRPIVVRSVDGPPDMTQEAERVRQELLYRLSQSPDLRLTDEARPEEHGLTVRGSLTMLDGGKVRLQITDDAGAPIAEAEGDLADRGFLAQQTANRVNLHATGRPLPIEGAQPPGPPGPRGKVVDLAKLLQEMQNAPPGPVQLTVGVDRGPGGIYQGGQPVAGGGGDLLRVRVTANRDCCVALYDIGSDGVARLILPNEHDNEVGLQAGQVRTVPADGSWRYRVVLPAGRETILAIASLDPKDLPGVAAQNNKLGQPIARDLFIEAVPQPLGPGQPPPPRPAGRGSRSFATVDYFIVP